MGTSENDFQDLYHDDPIEQISHSKFRSKFLTTGVLILGSIFFFQSTLASNISLSSGGGIEFGQGISQTVACSGGHSLTLTPRSSFTNGSGSSGDHYLKSVTVSDIPDSCFGVDFTIRAYNDTSSTSLALFNTSSTSAVIYDDAGAFSRGSGSTGMTVTSGSGTFTATFTTPVAQSSNVFKLTIQSGGHTPFYPIGSTGPGGGFVYYANDAGFSCGATFTDSGSPTGGLCHYLEVAQWTWNGSQTKKQWAVTAFQNTDVSTITNEGSAYNNALAVGLGYKNSIAIVTQNGVYNASSNDYAAGAARAYSGGSKSDWYLPTLTELNLLCQWDRGIASSVTTACNGGSTDSATYGAGFAAILQDECYFTSSENSAATVWCQSMDGVPTHQSSVQKLSRVYVRPVRAF